MQPQTLRLEQSADAILAKLDRCPVLSVRLSALL